MSLLVDFTRCQWQLVTLKSIVPRGDSIPFFYRLSSTKQSRRRKFKQQEMPQRKETWRRIKIQELFPVSLNSFLSFFQLQTCMTLTWIDAFICKQKKCLAISLDYLECLKLVERENYRHCCKGHRNNVRMNNELPHFKYPTEYLRVEVSLMKIL